MDKGIELTQEVENGMINLVVQNDELREVCIGDHLERQEGLELLNLLSRYKNIFTDGSKIDTCNLVKHKIELIDAKPFNQPLRRMADKERENVLVQSKKKLKKCWRMVSSNRPNHISILQLFR